MTYILPPSNFGLYTDHQTGNPILGNIVELSSNFAFCEVLFCFGTAHLVSVDPAQLKRIVSSLKQMCQPGRSLILCNLQYWNRSIPGCQDEKLLDLRTKNHIFQAFEITKTTKFIAGPPTQPNRQASFSNFPDEVLEKVARSPVLQDMLRQEIVHSASLLIELPDPKISRYQYDMWPPSRLSHRLQTYIWRPYDKCNAKFRPSNESVYVKKSIPTQEADNPSQKDLDLKLQVEPKGSELPDDDSDDELGAEGEVPASLGKLVRDESSHPIWECSTSNTEAVQVEIDSVPESIPKLSFFDDDYEENIAEQILCKKTNEIKVEQSEMLPAEVIEPKNHNNEPPTVNPETVAADSTIETRPLPTDKTARLALALEKFAFLEGKSPAEWYSQLKQNKQQHSYN
jgi:hypothetical protein